MRQVGKPGLPLLVPVRSAANEADEAPRFYQATPRFSRFSGLTAEYVGVRFLLDGQGSRIENAGARRSAKTRTTPLSIPKAF